MSEAGTIKRDAPSTFQISAADGRSLLTIHPDGTVDGAIEDAGEAARRFVESLRLDLAVAQVVPQPNREALRDALTTVRGIVKRNYHDAQDIISRIDIALSEPAPALSPAPLTIDREALAKVLEESLYDRGIDVGKWPEDEAEAYREFRFAEGVEAARKVTFQKAADAVIAHLSAQSDEIAESVASSDESFDLGKVAGYDEAVREVSAQPVEGEVTRTVWHKDQFWVNIETDAEGLVTINDELLVKLMTESGWVVQP